MFWLRVLVACFSFVFCDLFVSFRFISFVKFHFFLSSSASASTLVVLLLFVCRRMGFIREGYLLFNRNVPFFFRVAILSMT